MKSKKDDQEKKNATEGKKKSKKSADKSFEEEFINKMIQCKKNA